MPLLPRPWPLPVMYLGCCHSRWTCRSRNSSLDWIAPLLGTTTSAPPSAFHFTSPSPFSGFHLERSVPSNSTTASLGGLAGWSVAGITGVTAAGCGRFMSWTSYPSLAAPSFTSSAPTERQATANTDTTLIRTPLALFMSVPSSCVNRDRIVADRRCPPPCAASLGAAARVPSFPLPVFRGEGWGEGQGA